MVTLIEKEGRVLHQTYSHAGGNSLHLKHKLMIETNQLEYVFLPSKEKFDSFKNRLFQHSNTSHQGLVANVSRCFGEFFVWVNSIRVSLSCYSVN